MQFPHLSSLEYIYSMREVQVRTKMCDTDRNDSMLSARYPLEGGKVLWSRNVMRHETNAA